MKNMNNDYIEEPKVSLVDNLKYKLGYFQGRSKIITTVIGITVMAGVSLFVAYASLNRQSVTSDKIDAANPSCQLNLALRPPPTAPPCVESPVDIVIALDRSGSMGTNGVNNKMKSKLLLSMIWEMQKSMRI